MDLDADTAAIGTNRPNSDFGILLSLFILKIIKLIGFKFLIIGSAELEIELMSRRGSQSDDGSLFAQLEGTDTLFSVLTDDVDDNLNNLPSDSSRPSIEPVVSINPIRFPFSGSTSLLASNAQNNSLNSQVPSQIQSTSDVTISPIPSRRGPGRPRKDGKVPIQRKNLFPGRPRMRGRKTLNVLGSSSSSIPSNDPTSNTLSNM